MALLSRVGLSLALAALGAACDLGLDPAMIGDTGAGGGSTSSSASAGGGVTSSSTTATTSTGAAGGGGSAGGGAGGAGGGAPVVLTPCAAADDFETFDENSATDAWNVVNDAEGVVVDDREVRLSLQQGDSAIQQTLPADLDACFVSARFNYQAGPDATFLSFTCGTAQMRYVVDADASTAFVAFLTPPEMPPEVAQVTTPTLTTGADLRVLFRQGEVVFELRPMGGGDFVTTHSFEQQSWMTGCRIGLGVTGGGTSVCRVDDFCLDPP